MPEMTTFLSSFPRFGCKGDQQCSILFPKLPENNQTLLMLLCRRVGREERAAPRAGWWGYSPTQWA